MTKRMTTIMLAVCSVMAARSARADDGATRPLDQLSLHLNLGGEAAGNDHLVSTGVRLHAGVGMSSPGGRVRPMVALGGTFGNGTLQVDDPRALRGWLSLGYFEYGPEAQIGLRFANGGHVDTRIFASAAYLRAEIDHRLRLDPVPGVTATRNGFRFSVGGNWADRLDDLATSSSGKNSGYEWIVFLLPQQLEVNMERSFGSSRYGVTLSYGI